MATNHTPSDFHKTINTETIQAFFINSSKKILGFPKKSIEVLPDQIIPQHTQLRSSATPTIYHFNPSTSSLMLGNK